MGFEPMNNGFAIRPLSPLGYSAEYAKNTQRTPNLQRFQQFGSTSWGLASTRAVLWGRYHHPRLPALRRLADSCRAGDQLRSA